MKLSLPDPLFVDFLFSLQLFLLIDSYSVARQPLGPSRLTHDKMNICHQLIVEHHWISKGKERKVEGQNQYVCIAFQLYGNITAQ